jgi:hypothetical protein
MVASCPVNSHAGEGGDGYTKGIVGMVVPLQFEKYPSCIYSLSMKTTPIYIFEEQNIYPYLYYSVIGDLFLYHTKIQNNHTNINFVPYHGKL